MGERLLKRLYLILGFFFFALGAVGAVLPVLPTVPFLLLASVFFAKGSLRYQRWFVSTRLYQNYLREYQETRAMTIQAKLVILLPVSAMLILAMLLVDNRVMRLFLVCLLIVKYYFFIFRIGTLRGPRPQARQGEDQV